MKSCGKTILGVAIVIFIVFWLYPNLFPWKESGIPQALQADDLIKTAGNTQKITLVNKSSGEEADFRSFEAERHFNVTVTSGTRGQLLDAYRQQVENLIKNKNAKICGTGVSTDQSGTQDFSYDYIWNGNKGIIRVYSLDNTNGEIQMLTFCYEHQK